MGIRKNRGNQGDGRQERKERDTIGKAQRCEPQKMGWQPLECKTPTKLLVLGKGGGGGI